MLGCLGRLLQLGAIGAFGLTSFYPPATNVAESAIYWGTNIETPNFGIAVIPKFTIKYIPSVQEVIQQHPMAEALPGNWQLSDKEIICSIGASEGTRARNCEATKAYYGHTDPGNKKWNMGTFSYQHGASTPEEADAKWLPTLRKAENDMQAAAKQKFGEYLSPKASAAGLDAYTQSPHAAGFYVGYLTSANPSFEQVLEARTKSLNRSRSIYPGSPMNVRADQRRRLMRVWEQIHR